MPIRVYNTLTGKKEECVPIREGKVGMYVCGVTVYDLCHVGHARSAIIFDMIYRYLQYRGYGVTFVRNFTDIDDKIINRANQEGTDYKTIAKRYIREFEVDMGALGLEKATIEPRATDHIPEMIRLISTLVENGYAYQGGNDVFYSVERFKDYGKLSKRNLEQMQAGARVEIDEKKRNPLDFVLWKGSKPGEPFWESPWRKGRPGWHIECSVMSMKYLGETFDIHGGGKDLVFPHHENEIAQSEGATGKPFARYWIHNGFININKEKMSKSLGNILTIKEVLKEWHPEVLRLFFLSSHYRSPLDYTEESLKEAKAGLDRFYSTFKAVQDELKRPAQPPSQARPSPSKGEGAGGGGAVLAQCGQAVESFEARFEEAMDDDFNTAQSIGYLFDLQTHLNSLLTLSKGRPTEEILSLLKKGSDHFSKTGGVFGLFRENPENYLEAQKKAGLKKLNLMEEEILKLIEDRNAARKEKNWKRSDEIRNELLNKGVVLEDTPSGTNWKLK